MRLYDWPCDRDLSYLNCRGSFSARPGVLSRVIESGNIVFICCALYHFRFYFFWRFPLNLRTSLGTDEFVRQNGWLPLSPSKLLLLIDEIHLSRLLNGKHGMKYPRNETCWTLGFRYVLVSSSCYEWADNNLSVTVSPGNQYFHPPHLCPPPTAMISSAFYLFCVFRFFMEIFFFQNKLLALWEWFSSPGVLCWQTIGTRNEGIMFYHLLSSPLQIWTWGVLKSSRFALKSSYIKNAF